MLIKRLGLLISLVVMLVVQATVFAAEEVYIKNANYRFPSDVQYLTVYKTANPNYYSYLNHHSVYIPANISTVELAGNGKGAHFYTNDGAELTVSWMYNVIPNEWTVKYFYDQFLSKHPDAAVKTFGPNWYVGCYVENNKVVYTKHFINKSEVHGLSFIYPVSLANKYSKVCEVIDATFTPSWAM